eukprot:snap_masked-scaffold_4-processed-gene-8.39-mRNA-1 protein AED:0.29 eAED:0.29 QI:0/-1/0/1/-1/1/1/0/376
MGMLKKLALVIVFIALILGISREAVNQTSHRSSFPFNLAYTNPGVEKLFDLNLRGKVVIVTGANAGLGKSTVKLLAINGATVIMGCRNMKKCNDAKAAISAEILLMGEQSEYRRKVKMMFEKKNLLPMEMDLGSLSSINKFANKFQSQFKHLHSLILNGGLIPDDFSKTSDGIEMAFGVNHVGHFYLTKLLMPQLELSQPSTIVSVTSALHHMELESPILFPEKIVTKQGPEVLLKNINNETKFSSFASYGQSKLANILFTYKLARDLKASHKKIYVNCVHPGVVSTNMFEDTGSNEILSNVLKKVISWVLYEPDTAAKVQVHLAVGQEIFENEISGKYYIPLGEQFGSSEASYNIVTQEKLWTLTDEIIRELGYA